MARITCIKISSIILLFTIFCSATHADFDLGLQHYEKNQFKEAFKEFEEDAKLGDHDAQLNLGVMHYRGEHVAQNSIVAYAWMKLAAQEQNIAKEAFYEQVFNQLSPEQRNNATQEYEKLFAVYGNPTIDKKITPDFKGQYSNFKKHRIIKTIVPTFPKEMIHRNASGFVDVTFTIDKQGFTRDYVVNYSSYAAFAKSAIAALRQFQYEPTLVNNSPVEVNGIRNRFHFLINGNTYDKKKTIENLDNMKKEAITGDSSAKLNVGFFLEVIPSFVPDFDLKDNPNEWYLSSAQQGNATASYLLGRNILYGNQCKQDTNQSQVWLLKAAKQGVADAQYLLAMETFSGARFEKSEDKGFYWLEKAATHNQPAKIRLAWILATHPDEKRRNGIRASKLLEGFNKSYYDQLNLLQTRAAVYAENDDFKNAFKWQDQAIDLMKKLELPADVANERLAHYQNNKKWRESF